MKSQVNNRPKCPVSDEGCSPVVTLTTQMRIVGWGAKAAIANLLVIVVSLLTALCFLFGRMAVKYLSNEAIAKPIVQVAPDARQK